MPRGCLTLARKSIIVGMLLLDFENVFYYARVAMSSMPSDSPAGRVEQRVPNRIKRSIPRAESMGRGRKYSVGSSASV
jgi:hypothetical protein